MNGEAPTLILTIVLTITINIVARRQKYRTLLRITCLALLVTVICRNFEPAFNGLAMDLIKRLAILTAQLCVVLIISSLHPRALARWPIHLVAMTIAAGECALIRWLPQHSDGTVYHLSQIQFIHDRSDRAAFLGYNLLYLSGFIATACVVTGACLMALRHREYSPAMRLSLHSILCAGIGTALLNIISLGDLMGIRVSDGHQVRTALLILVLLALLLGFANGAGQHLLTKRRHRTRLRRAQEMVTPLWRTMTNLHPEVILPLATAEKRHMDPELLLMRSVIETLDALRLMREDPDPGLMMIHEQHPCEPGLSVALIRHLSGDHHLAPLTEAQLRRATIPVEQFVPVADLASTLGEIRAIRLEFTAQLREKTATPAPIAHPAFARDTGDPRTALEDLPLR